MAISLYFLCRIVLAVIVLSALFSKTGEPLFDANPTNTGVKKTLSKMMEMIHQPFVIIIAYLVVGAAAPLAPAIGAAMQLLLILTGFLLKKFHIIEECNCYGSLVRKTGPAQLVITWVLLLNCTFILAMHQVVFSSSGVNSTNVFFQTTLFIITLMIAMLIGKAITRDIPPKNETLTPTSVSANDKNAVPKKYFPSEIVIGTNNARQEVKLTDIVDHAPLLLFIGLSNGCHDCSAAKPDLFRLAELFAERIQTVFLFDKMPDLTHFPQGPIALEYSGKFFDSIQAVGFPFAVLVNPIDLGQMGATVYTPRNIWLLYYLALGLLEPEE